MFVTRYKTTGLKRRKGPECRDYRVGARDHLNSPSIESCGFWQATRRGVTESLNIKLTKDSLVVLSDKRI